MDKRDYLQEAKDRAHASKALAARGDFEAAGRTMDDTPAQRAINASWRPEVAWLTAIGWGDVDSPIVHVMRFMARGI